MPSNSSQHQHSTTDSNIIVKEENADYTENNQQQQLLDETNQQDQQMICVQSDGTITLQTMSKQLQQQQPSQEEQLGVEEGNNNAAEEDLIVAELSRLPLNTQLVNAAGKIAITPYGEGKKIMQSKRAKTVSDTLRETYVKKIGKRLQPSNIAPSPSTSSTQQQVPQHIQIPQSTVYY